MNFSTHSLHYGAVKRFQYSNFGGIPIYSADLAFPDKTQPQKKWLGRFSFGHPEQRISARAYVDVLNRSIKVTLSHSRETLLEKTYAIRKNLWSVYGLSLEKEPKKESIVADSNEAKAFYANTYQVNEVAINQDLEQFISFIDEALFPLGHLTQRH